MRDILMSEIVDSKLIFNEEYMYNPTAKRCSEVICWIRNGPTWCIWCGQRNKVKIEYTFSQLPSSSPNSTISRELKIF